MLPFQKKFRVNSACAFSRDRFVVALVLDEHADDPDLPHGTVWIIEDGSTWNLAKHFHNIVATAFGHDGTVHSLGEWGQFVSYVGDEEPLEEELDASRGPLRSMRQVPGGLVAAGAGSHVFLRPDAGDWTDISPTVEMREQHPMNIFESVDGYSTSDIYAAGSDGTIWHFDGVDWQVDQLDTELDFYDITCGSDGVVWACGQSGALAKGHVGSFELLTAERETGDLWGIAFHEQRVWASENGLVRRLDGDTLVEDADFPGETAYSLQSVADVLFSFGMKDIVQFDGDGWSRIDEVTPV